MSTVSVIIVSWNARSHLSRCLTSLTAGACRCPMEIIVVDNGSTDGSPELVAREWPEVRLIRNHENLGFAKANNIGIASSTGQYLCLVNSDVKLSPDCITRLVGFCVDHPDVGIVGPRVIGADGVLQRSCRGFPSVWRMFCCALALDSVFAGDKLVAGYSMAYWQHDSVRPVDILSGCFWLVRREALIEVGLLDESFFIYGEDMDWCKRFWAAGWKVVFVPTAEVVHYGGGSSSNAPVRFYLERHRADLRYWKKYHSAVGVACYVLILILHMALRAVGHGLASLYDLERRETHRFKVRRSIACLRWMLGGEHLVLK